MQCIPNGADSDGDGVDDNCDVCPSVVDREQVDSDGDGFGDACDDCPLLYNPTQRDAHHAARCGSVGASHTVCIA